MLKWLFRKRIASAEAVEAYLSHFDEGELAYLKNITLMGVLPNPIENVGLTLSDRILLCAYIHAEWLVARGEIEATPMERARVRAIYNLQLARDLGSLRGKELIEYFKAIGPHRLDEQPLTDDQEERLGNHSTVLERIFVNPRGASTLPELNEIGEGKAWLPKAVQRA